MNATAAVAAGSSRAGGGDLRLVDWFCGAGGSTQGAVAVPGVRPVHAANHWAQAILTHQENFPDVDHWRGDIRAIDVARLPYAELFWASPECTQWSKAKGRRQDYACLDVALPGLEEPAPAEEVERSRALMEEVPLYLRAMALRGRPVLAGVVENVVDIRAWTDWDRWRSEIEAVGYRSRLVALNSMHAQSVVTPRAPQSRDRLYLAYWHLSLGRDPDWDKWLRPAAWCPRCATWVRAVQVFKAPGRDMGRYRSQYVYRCPASTCRGTVVEPAYVPAAAVIDWALPAQRIGDRDRPLAAKTVARIAAGIRRYARPVHVEAGGHQYDAADPRHPQHGDPDGYYRAWPDTTPLKTLHTSLTKGVAIPPAPVVGGGSGLLVPVEGRTGKTATPAERSLRTQSTRAETALVTVPTLVPALLMRNNTPNGDPAQMCTPVTEEMRTLTTTGHQSLLVAPFVAELRGGGSVARAVTEPLATVTASGNHHGLVTPDHALTSGTAEAAALYAYDAGVRDLGWPLPTQTTVEGDAVLTGLQLPAVEDCRFRMLEPAEVIAGMAFTPTYRVLGNRRQKVRQAGNAVTPPAAEVLIAALVETITGETLEPAPLPTHTPTVGGAR